jgi:Bacterial mobilisation protein (MobC)
MLRMAADAFIHCRVPVATKAAFGVLARLQGMTDSALLRRMIDLSFQAAGVVSGTDAVAAPQPSARASRLTVRLRGDDQLLLRERAAARGMAPATYVSVLTRAHLRSLAPLPREELLALKRTVAELGAIGRNLNQIARAANQGEQVDGRGPPHVQLMLRVCGALRDHVKALLLANLRSWQEGYANSGEHHSERRGQ